MGGLAEVDRAIELAPASSDLRELAKEMRRWAAKTETERPREVGDSPRAP